MRRAWPLLVAIVLMAPLAQADHVPRSEIGWACGYFGGHPDDCGIDPVGGDHAVQSEGDPQFKPAGDDDWISGSARVIGIERGGESKAYPIKILNAHEIVNDAIGGDNIAVTFCPLCGSGVTFLRSFQFDGATIETNFTASGYLWSTDMVMWDPVTNQLWNQITGQPIAALDGDRPAPDHADLQLPVIASSLTTWSNWVSKHPNTELLQPVRPIGSYREDQYASASPDNCRQGASGRTDCDVAGMHPKVQIVGHDDGAGGVAFPIRDVSLAGGAAYFETKEGRGFVGTGDIHGDTRIFDAAGHVFTRDGSGLWSDESGGLWDLRDGLRLDAPGQLEVLPNRIMFWFAWHDHFPDTEVWLPEGGASEPPPNGRGIPGISLPILAVALLAIARFSRKRS